MPPHWLRRLVENTLFNTSLRVYLLRILVTTSIICIVAMVVTLKEFQGFDATNRTTFALWCAYLVIIPIHHITSAFRLKYWIEIFDFVLLSVEFAAWFILKVSVYPQNLSPWSNGSIIIFSLCVVVEIVALGIFWILRLSSIVKSKGRCLFTAFDLLSGCESSEHGSRYTVALGRKLWGQSTTDRTEPKPIRIMRALVALAFLTAIMTFALFAIFVGPITQAALLPSKTFRTQLLPMELKFDVPVWSVVVFTPGMFDYSAPRDRQGFRSAVRVRALWRNITLNEDVLRRNYFRSSTPEYPRCSALGVESDIMLETGLAAAITFYCPPRIVYDGSLRMPGNLTTTNQESRSIYLADWPLTVPDLLITVNWTAIGMTADPLTDAAFTSVNVMVALTNQTLDAIRDTTAIPMHPGSRLLGSLTRSFRQRFGDTQRAALGIPDSFNTKTFLTSQVTSLTPDTSPLLPVGNDVGTLRLYLQQERSDWVVAQDVAEKSVWAGLAAVGGLWTTIEAIFAFIFGSSILLVICGVKPFSVFGLVHMCRRRRIRTAWLRDFPMITTEGGTAGDENAGLVAFLREHFTDLESLEETREGDDHVAHTGGNTSRGNYDTMILKDMDDWDASRDLYSRNA